MHSLLRSRLMFVMLFGVGFARAADGVLPLDAGTYVVADYKPCEEAPFAGVTSFDGMSFVGPHDSDCRTKILEQSGSKFRVSVRCKADGSGTPIKHPSTFIEGVRIESRTSFVFIKGAVETRFALCPAFH